MHPFIKRNALGRHRLNSVAVADLEFDLPLGIDAEQITFVTVHVVHDCGEMEGILLNRNPRGYGKFAVEVRALCRRQRDDAAVRIKRQTSAGHARPPIRLHATDVTGLAGLRFRGRAAGPLVETPVADQIFGEPGLHR